ncbi:MAG TPA: hypothetical protein PLT27_13265 [Nitrospira sp.]|nr:hypothetical protein [Nitrospira sp.]
MGVATRREPRNHSTCCYFFRIAAILILMDTIHKQLVTDEQGRPVSVLIPYLEWLKIEQQLHAPSPASKAQPLQHHAGMIQLSEDPLTYQRRLRDEWT